MKAIIRTALIFSLMAIGVAVFAQDGPKGYGKGKNMEKHIEKMKTELGITDAQSAQIKSIVEASKAEIKADVEAMKNAPKEDKAAARAELRKDQLAMREKILAVMTPEQRAKAEEMRGMFKDKMKEKRGNMRKNRQGGVDDEGSVTPQSGQAREKTSGQGQPKS